MESFDYYRIDLRSLPVGKSEFRYELDDSFFVSKEGTEITGGHLDVEVSVRSGETFDVEVGIHGTITIPCNRCLDDVEVPIDVEDRFFVRMGEAELDEGDDLLIVDEKEGVLDLEWHLYELIALQIPIVHEHEEGQCNPEMMSQLERHGAGSRTEKTEPDERWNALKKLAEKQDGSL
ncbi:MAG: DUF177 domain-containing protein [Paludibacteraceae bacterium]|nr:DUF177 domain-containing protein [Paludibacteraceae bacterium]